VSDNQITRAEVGVVTERGVTPSGFGFVRAEERSNPPLGFRQAPEPARPLPAPPTEVELRAELEQAIGRRREADAALHETEALHERGQRHVARCRTALSRYATLNMEIEDYTIDALREGDGRAELPEELRTKLNERGVAEIQLIAAERAAQNILRERAVASKAAGDAAKKIEALSVRVLAFEAERLAQRHAELQARAAAIRKSLAGFDRLATSHKVGLPFAVQHALSGDSYALYAPDLAPWMEMEARLRENAMAEVEIRLREAVIEEPPRPMISAGPPQPSPSFIRPPPSEVQDDGDPGYIPPE
jgi:hypothetical protein